MINCSPIHDNEYVRKNITINFKEDFSACWLSDGKCTILLECATFKDVFDVMSRAVTNDSQQWNILGTAFSLPYEKEEFNVAPENNT